MQKVTKYTVFRTKWGYFGLAGTQSAICRTHLPTPEPEKIKFQLLKDTRAAQYDKTFFTSLQEQITAYFEGVHIDFDPSIPVFLEGISSFTTSILTACRRIEFGRVVTYSQLARELGQPAAARAVGNALAKNPLPLIIPCHRVVRRDGKVGGFSAPNGRCLKAMLLRHEHAVLPGCESVWPDIHTNDAHSIPNVRRHFVHLPPGSIS